MPPGISTQSAFLHSDLMREASSTAVLDERFKSVFIQPVLHGATEDSFPRPNISGPYQTDSNM
jgi:hypothetical protein